VEAINPEASSGADLLPARDDRPGRAAGVRPDTGGPRGYRSGTLAEAAQAAVTALYEIHAVGLIRLAVVMLGDRPAAEDVVHDGFCGLYRRWEHLADQGNALSYLRSSILNGCRSELRRRIRSQRRAARQAAVTDSASPEADILIGEEHREVLAALRRLPRRQREALVLRFYLDLPDPEIATSMGVTQGTVKSTTSRGLSALARLLGEQR
jgi:RNA polymerase sigma-70 factor (sigma-E family)